MKRVAKAVVATASQPDNISVTIPAERYLGGVLSTESAVSPIAALGDAIARFEDAVLKQQDPLAVAIAIDIAWLARECALRRGDEGYDVLKCHAVGN